MIIFDLQVKPLVDINFSIGAFFILKYPMYYMRILHLLVNNCIFA